MSQYAVIDTKSGWVVSVHETRLAAEKRYGEVVKMILENGGFEVIMPWLPPGISAAEIGPYLAVMRVDNTAASKTRYSGKLLSPGSPTTAHNHTKLGRKKTA